MHTTSSSLEEEEEHVLQVRKLEISDKQKGFIDLLQQLTVKYNMTDCFIKSNNLNRYRIDWKILVRCCRKWQVPAHENFSDSFKFLTVDKFASLKEYITDRVLDLISEDGLYHIE
ncbi:hypothetical protein OROHE_015873 [Orobanche hederae]